MFAPAFHNRQVSEGIKRLTSCKALDFNTTGISHCLMPILLSRVLQKTFLKGSDFVTILS